MKLYKITFVWNRRTLASDTEVRYVLAVDLLDALHGVGGAAERANNNPSIEVNIETICSMESMHVTAGAKARLGVG